ncbi:MAG: hypothetical protein HY077_08835 [Elusimicrobia bacterium]|nr:hypothetical protein [Elusimicrobiota bacterium]
MLQKVHSAAFSAYCSLIMSSILMTAAPQAYQAAAMAFPDAVQRAARNGLTGLSRTVKADFEKQKTWWLKQLGEPQVAQDEP